MQADVVTLTSVKLHYQMFMMMHSLWNLSCILNLAIIIWPDFNIFIKEVSTLLQQGKEHFNIPKLHLLLTLGGRILWPRTKLSMHALLRFLMLGDASRVRGANCKEVVEEEASLSSLEQIIVEPPILNQDSVGNLHGAIISIRLGLILVLLWVVRIRVHFSQFLRVSYHVGRSPTIF